MNRRALLASMAAGSLLGSRLVRARDSPEPRRLGVLLATSEQEAYVRGAGADPGLMAALAALGYVEARNLRVEWRAFEADFSRARRMAAELVGLGMDALLTVGTPQTRILREATNTIPIVALVADPVTSGFTGTQGRPSGNVTGLAGTHPGTAAKRIELFRSVVPRLDRLMIIGSARHPGAAESTHPVEAAARAAGLLPEVRMLDPDAFERVFADMEARRVRAAHFFLEQFPLDIDSEVAGLAIRHGLATMDARSSYVKRGGLMSFGMAHLQPFVRLASIIDKILRGRKPAEIPWELPDRSSLAINLATARKLGLVIPAELRLRADQVVE